MYSEKYLIPKGIGEMNLYQTNQNNHPNAIPSNPSKYLYIEYEIYNIPIYSVNITIRDT
jgi:hypothetical protein